MTARAAAALALVLTASPAHALDWPGRAAAVATAIDAAIDAEARAARVRDAASLDPADAAPLLRSLLDDPEPEVRAAACETVGALHATALLDDVLQRLADREPEVRVAAAHALGQIAEPAAHEALARAVADPEFEVRAAALGALARVGAPEAFATIVGSLSDRRREVVVAALGALGELGRPEAVYALLDRADDPSSEVAEAAVRSLAALGAPEAVPTYVRLVRSAPVGVSLAAIDAAVAVGAREVTPALASEVLSPRAPETAEAALRALARLADPSQAARVAPLLRRAPERVIDYFVALGAAGAPYLEQAWREADERRRALLLDAWLRTGDLAALDEVPSDLAAYDGETEPLRESFARSAAPEAVCRAVDAVSRPDDPTEWLRWAAERDALPCIPVAWSADAEIDASTAAGIATSWLRSGDAASAAAALPGPEARWEDVRGVLAAAALAGEIAAPVLDQLLHSDDSRVRREAAMLLGELGQTAPAPDAPWLRGETLYATRAWLDDPSVRAGLAARFDESASPVTRAAWRMTLARDCREVGERGGTTFAELRADAIARVHCGGPLSLAGDAVERAAALRTAGLEAVFRAWRHGTGIERAAALVRWSELEPAEARRAAWNARLTDDLSIAVAAAWVWAATLDDDTGRVQRAAAAEARPAVEAALRSGLAARGDAAAPQPAGDGEGRSEVVWVYAVDREQGTPRADSAVIVVPPAGMPFFSATGADGVTLARAVPAARVFVLGEQ